MSKVAIVGMGYVGKSMLHIFPDAVQYDREKGNRDEVNACDLAIVCVPTQPKDGSEFSPADVSVVEEVVNWLKTPLILIKSTVPPGTTLWLDSDRVGSRVCFSPEFVGEGTYYTPPQYPNPTNPLTHDFMIIGGDTGPRARIASIFQERLGPSCKFHLCYSDEAELIKYLDNCWGATKVTFFNEIYDLTRAMRVDFETVRQGLLLDRRVEPMHTAVFPDKRGFGGKCFPKDTMALVAFAQANGVELEVLKAVIRRNNRGYNNDNK